MTVLEAKTCAACDSKFVPKSRAHKYCSEDCRKGKTDKTAPLPEFTLTDPSNHLLSSGPSALSCGVTKIGEEPALLMTIRTSSTTLTVALTYKEAAAWLAEIAYKVKDMQDAQESPD